MKYVFITIPPFEDTLTCQAESSAYEKIIFYDVKVYRKIFNLPNAPIEHFLKQVVHTQLKFGKHRVIHGIYLYVCKH